MEQESWSREVVSLIAESIKHYRKRRKMSAQKVADECERLGYTSLTRSVITSLELGARESVSVPELHALAAALRVPPLLLLFPIGRSDSVRVLPEITVAPKDAISWALTGELVGLDPGPYDEDATTISNFLGHEDAVLRWRTCRAAVTRAQQLLAKGDDELERLGEDRQELEIDVLEARNDQDKAVSALRRIRADLRRAHLAVPELPASLTFIDESRR